MLTIFTCIISRLRRLDLFVSNSCFHCEIQSLIGVVPPYSAGSTDLSMHLCKLSSPECVLNLFRIFSERRLLANWNTRVMAQGSFRKWISWCLMGRARSQQLNALLTSDGVQTVSCDQDTPSSSMTYVNPRTWFSSLLSRVSKVSICARIMSLVVNLDGSKALALENMTLRPCESRLGNANIYPKSIRSDNAVSYKTKN